MPLFDDDNMETSKIAGTNYTFSATRIQDLAASEYTLVVLACDESGSVDDFRAELEACIKESVRACRRSPRADNLMLRLVTFNSRLKEVHGFRPLSECHEDKYDGSLRPGGMTALYDACVSAVQSAVQYGESLSRQDFDVNAIVIAITDGDDNQSALDPAAVRAAITAAVQGEALESIRTVLVGVNVQNATMSQYLQHFKTEGGFDQYVELKDASAKTLAKLAAFVSQSVSSQSQALGSGGPSQALVI